MSKLGDIRAGIVSNFSTFFAGTVSWQQFDGYPLNPVAPPCFEVDYAPAQTVLYHQGGAAPITVVVRGFAGLRENTEATETLDEWLEESGSTSVKAAIESDQTLGSIVDQAIVTSGEGKLVRVEDGSVLVVGEWTVEILS